MFEPKLMGSHLRQLGFCPKRDSQGFAIHLTAEVRRLTHRLRTITKLETWSRLVPGCPECAEGTFAQAGDRTRKLRIKRMYVCI